MILFFKKCLFFLVSVFSFFLFNSFDVKAAPSNFNQCLTTNYPILQSNIVCTGSLGRFNINKGLAFFYYRINFTDTSLKLNSPYRVNITFNADLGDGYFNSATYSWSLVDENENEIPMYNVTFTDNGQKTRYLQFDFIPVTSSRSFKLYTLSTTGEGVLYYSWSSSSM